MRVCGYQNNSMISPQPNWASALPYHTHPTCAIVPQSEVGRKNGPSAAFAAVACCAALHTKRKGLMLT